jgi:hypothetical protein
MTRIIADFHLHIYKVYPLESLLQSLFTNLNRAAGQARGQSPIVKAAFLAERRRYQVFQDWQHGHFRIRGFTITPRGPHCLEITTAKDDRLLLFAGRQVATAEGLEILSLANDRDIADALPFPEATARVLAAGGIPVLPWAPGKWGGFRQAIIRKGIEAMAGHGLMICDSSIRPAFFPDPALFHFARRLGVPIAAGTDTFPVAGEEELVGRYATLIEGDLAPEAVAEALPGLLRERAFTSCRRTGRRSQFPIAARRWLVHMFGNKNQTA